MIKGESVVRGGWGKAMRSETHPQHVVERVRPREVKHEQRAKRVPVVYPVQRPEAVLACRVEGAEGGGGGGAGVSGAVHKILGRALGRLGAKNAPAMSHSCSATLDPPISNFRK